MSAATLPRSTRRTAHFVSNSGHLRNEHFFLTADHLMLEVDPGTFELVTARAEGNIQIHMICADANQEYVAFGQSALYQAEANRITLNGWTGARHNGVNLPPSETRYNIVVPTDGSFFNVSSQETIAEQAA